MGFLTSPMLKDSDVWTSVLAWLFYEVSQYVQQKLHTVGCGVIYTLHSLLRICMFSSLMHMVGACKQAALMRW